MSRAISRVTSLLMFAVASNPPAASGRTCTGFPNRGFTFSCAIPFELLPKPRSGLPVFVSRMISYLPRDLPLAFRNSNNRRFDRSRCIEWITRSERRSAANRPPRAKVRARLPCRVYFATKSLRAVNSPFRLASAVARTKTPPSCDDAHELILVLRPERGLGSWAAPLLPNRLTSPVPLGASPLTLCARTWVTMMKKKQRQKIARNTGDMTTRLRLVLKLDITKYIVNSTRQRNAASNLAAGVL